MYDRTSSKQRLNGRGTRASKLHHCYPKYWTDTTTKVLSHVSKSELVHLPRLTKLLRDKETSRGPKVGLAITVFIRIVAAHRIVSALE